MGSHDTRGSAMAGRWKTSKELSAKSWSLVKDDRELFKFPVRGAIAGAGFALLGIVPGFALLALSDGNVVLLVAGGALVLAGAYLANLGWLVFQAGLVSAADELLHDRPATYAAAMAASKSARGALAGWAAINLVVNALISLVRGDGNGGVVVAVIRLIVAGIASTAWTLVNWFVMPVIVLEHLGAGAAIKRSTSLVKERWGEAIAGGVRITIRATWFLAIPGIMLLGGGVYLALTIDNRAAVIGGVVLGGAGFALLIAASVLGSAARTVYTVALYRYATQGAAIGPFTAEEMAQAVSTGGGSFGRTAA